MCTRRHPDLDAESLEPERCAEAKQNGEGFCQNMSQSDFRDVPLEKLEGQIWCSDCCIGESLNVKALSGTSIQIVKPEIQRLSYKAKYEAFEGLLAHWEKEGKLDATCLLILRVTKSGYLKNWEEAIRDEESWDLCYRLLEAALHDFLTKRDKLEG
ncbi:hypothetical protein PG989_010816 [Apiospora arundinis]